MAGFCEKWRFKPGIYLAIFLPLFCSANITQQVSHNESSEVNSCGGSECDKYVGCLLESVNLNKDSKERALSTYHGFQKLQNCKHLEYENKGERSFEDCFSFLSNPKLQLYLAIDGLNLTSSKFYWLPYGTGNFSKQASLCAKSGNGNLSKIESNLDAVLLGCIATTDSYGIGLTSKFIPARNETQWQWADHSTDWLQNWKPQQSAKDEEQCVIATANHMWDSVRCNYSVKPSCYKSWMKTPSLHKLGAVIESLQSLTSNRGNLTIGSKTSWVQTALKEMSFDSAAPAEFKIDRNRSKVIVTRRSGKKSPIHLEVGNSIVEAQFSVSECSEMIATFFEVLVEVARPEMQAADKHRSLSAKRLELSTMVFTGVFGYDVKTSVSANGFVSFTRQFAPKQSSVAKLCEQTGTDDWETMRPECVYIDQSTGDYSAEGCTYLLDKDNLTCNCNRLGVFSVVLSVKLLSTSFPLKIVSYVSEAIAILFLMLTVVLLVSYQRGNTYGHFPIQLSLTVSLLVFHAFNIASGPASANDAACVVVAAFKHLTILLSAFWMLDEGVRFLVISKNPIKFHSANNKKHSNIYVVTTWSAAIVIAVCAISIGLPLQRYMHKSFRYVTCRSFPNSTRVQRYANCWLDPKSPVFYATVVAPIGFILTSCTLLGYTATRASLGMSEKWGKKAGRERDEAKKMIGSYFFLLVTLGGSLVLEILASGINSKLATMTVVYIHTVAGGLQGVVVFMYYCVLDGSIRRKWRKNRETVNKAKIEPDLSSITGTKV